MKFIPQTDNINDYLINAKVIDYHFPVVTRTAKSLICKAKSELEKIEIIYHFVRDEIFHSADIGSQQVTCKASDVLKYSHGMCCAKSHLFAALARSIGVPTGFCYQKLAADENNRNQGFSIHGLNGVFLRDEKRWIRLDGRGNKKGVNAEFDIFHEKIVWPVRRDFDEYDYPLIYCRPLKEVVEVLGKSKTRKELDFSWPSIYESIKDK